MNDAASRVDGKYVLLAVLALGVIGAGGGWWYRKSLQRRPLELWGGEAAGLFIQARDVEICRLRAVVNDDDNIIRAEGKAYRAVDCVDADLLRGFVHLRHSLLNDHSFDWADVSDRGSDWLYIMRFRDGGKTATLLISADCRYALLAENGAKASVKPIASGIEQVIGGAWTKGGDERRERRLRSTASTLFNQQRIKPISQFRRQTVEERRLLQRFRPS